tara:strand:- start:860 stop:2254 length:1395 start_codon:yes stop_codon:yes gene_type:complete
MSENIFYSEIETINKLYKTKKISPDEVFNIFSKRIKNHNKVLNAFIDIYEDECSKFSKDLGNLDENDFNILTGITVGLKDLIDFKNKYTTAGSKILKNNLASTNSKITQDFINQKSIILGKTNLVEFAFGTLGINTSTNTCRNPWDIKRVPGGSSSGSAVAVSAGLTTFAIGTDTGGSVRMPASLCGITGFKPTYGMVSRRGVLDLSWTMDHVGPMARSAKDCLDVMSIISGYDSKDKYSINLDNNKFFVDKSFERKKIKIGLPKSYFFDDIDEEIKSSVLDAVKKLSNLGYQIEEIDLPFVEEGRSLNVGVLIPEALTIHKDYLKQYSKYSPTVINRLLGGIGITSEEYLSASKNMSEFNFKMTKKMKNFDAIITPTVPVATPLISDSLSPNTNESNSMGKFTGIFNLTGQPSISLPSGFTDKKMPIGMMLSGKMQEDNKLLNIAIDWQNHTDYHKQIPEGFN